MILTEVWVPGHPRTKGSLTAKGGYVQDAAHSKRWRAFMAEQVRQDIALRTTGAVLAGVHGVYPYAGPVAVWFVAWIPKGSTPGPDEPPIWHGAGDVDKLARNLLDALAADAKNAAMNGGVYANDNQVVRLSGEKFTARPEFGRPAGMLIQVMTYEFARSYDATWSATAERVRSAAALQ
jgi:Holliday junction resolvase RusA-like endonuclease